MQVTNGFDPQEAGRVAELYWQAFGPKLGKVLGPEPKALSFLSEVLNPAFALSCRDTQGCLLGVAGFKTSKGALVGGGISDLARHYGWWGALWRGLFLIVLERSLQDDVLQMDGIFVDPAARGQGAGTVLLEGIADLARAQGLSEVHLDVIDTNPRAQALYERRGFTAVSTEKTGLFKHVFGFSHATRMVRPVDQNGA